MGVLRIGFVLACCCFEAGAQMQRITITGTLQRVVAIGGESTGWAVQLDSPMTIGGNPVQRVEIAFGNTTELNRLVNKRVEVTGRLAVRKGVETGERQVLEVESIREAASTTALAGGEWLLEDLAGGGVLDRVQATLAFLEGARVAGNGSCNRFTGSVEIRGESVKFGRLASTRKACPPAIMDQEAKYLKALEAAERLEVSGPYLLVHCKGYDKPLRFTRRTVASNSGNLTQLFSRVWRVTDAPSTPAPGSIYVFLPNGTLLQTSCGETYRIAKWTVDKNASNVLRVVEDGRLAFTASISELDTNTVRLKQELARVKETNVLTMRGVEEEFVCPDLRR
jgi:heat shock protein HslJ